MIIFLFSRKIYETYQKILYIITIFVFDITAIFDDIFYQYIFYCLYIYYIFEPIANYFSSFFFIN